MASKYVHQPLNQEVTAIGGHYLLVKEVRLPFEGREVLYLVGHAAFDTICCGPGGCDRLRHRRARCRRPQTRIVDGQPVV